MIPLRDVIPSRTTPYITIAIIALNAVVFGYQFLLSQAPVDPGLPDPSEAFILYFGLIPAAFSWVTVLTSMFLHGGFLHFAGNMWFLWIFGDNVEDRFGHARYAAFYLLCGVAAALAQTAMTPDSIYPMVGASGAIAGVMGAYLVMYPRSRIVTLLPLIIFFTVVEIPAIFFLGFWFLMQFVSGIGSVAEAGSRPSMGGVAFWAHVAGFAVGVLGVFLFRRPERQTVEWWDRTGRG
jgi:membrane associated rhomboid family serine protease